MDTFQFSHIKCTSHLNQITNELSKLLSRQLQLDGLRMILNQNRETITSLEFVNCKISLAFLETICCTLAMEGKQMHGVKHFAVKASKFSEANLDSLPPQLISFLSSR